MCVSSSNPDSCIVPAHADALNDLRQLADKGATDTLIDTVGTALIGRADAALFKAKQAGRNRVRGE